MCGITGIFDLNCQAVSPVLLKNMTTAIAHRGPDDEGIYIDGCIGFGHRRLSIIDLTPTGHQPMVTPDKRYALTYNGEVYNFRELRAELQSLGHRFISTSDSEVVLHAYAEWGSACVDRFNGMFAFAVWDAVEKKLFLARDRYGIKPLYYAVVDNVLLFASEQKAIITYPRLKRELDLEALVEYFSFQNIFTDRTFLKNVRLFPPATWASISLDKGTGSLSFRKYWDFMFKEPESPVAEEEYIEELDRLFRQAVKRQLVSDVDVGAYLSGGMDSGSITALAAQEIPYIKSFTCGFDLSSASGIEVTYDERSGAEYMSYLFKTEHYEMVLKSGDMERIMPMMAWHIEEPRVGQSYPNYYVAQLASKFVKVVLAGTGGDELFGGYPWRYYRAAGSSNFEDYVDNYYQFWQRLIPNKTIKDVFQPVWNDVRHVWTRDIFKSVFLDHEHVLRTPEDYINHSLCFEARTFLHGLLLVDDKLSMAHSLETRVPFLDNDLVDFAIRIPVRYKLRNLGKDIERPNENEPGPKQDNYFKRTQDGKLILRKIMERYIPVEITEREKQGFSAPDASWFKGESIDYVKRMLYNDRAELYNYLHKETIQGLVDQHLHGIENRRLLIWSLLNFENWCKRFLG